MLAAIKSQIPFFKRKKANKKDDILQPGTQIIQMRILKKERDIHWCKDRVSFKIFTEGNNEISLFYGLLLKEQKKEVQKGELKYVDSFGINPPKDGNAKLSIIINSEALKKVKTEYDMKALLTKILEIKTRTNGTRHH